MNEQSFTVTVNGINYDVETSGQNSKGYLRIRTGDIVVTETWGYCNPMQALWENHTWRTLPDAARQSAELHHIRDVVAHAVEQHLLFCLDQITEQE